MAVPYRRDNTASSLAVITLVGAAVTVIALLIGLSDKPQIDRIGISVTAQESQAATQAASSAATDGAEDANVLGDPVMVESALAASTNSQDTQSEGAGLTAAQADGSDAVVFGDTADTTGTATSGARAAVAGSGTAIGSTVDSTSDSGAAAATNSTGSGGSASDASLAENATSLSAEPASQASSELGNDFIVAEPTPTPGIAAAVLPTPAPTVDTNPVPSSISPGTATGSFFTRADEDEGATVSQNEVTLTLESDGTGTFAGALAMTLADGTVVELEMAGPFTWSATDSPQIVAPLTGTFSYDSLTNTEDIKSGTAELTVTSVGSGSGSLCAPTCYGFRFPPQTGF